jgi:hypothetical protein
MKELINKQILECKWLGVNKILREKYGFKGNRDNLSKDIPEAKKVFPNNDTISLYLSYRQDAIELHSYFHSVSTWVDKNRTFSPKNFYLEQFSIDELVNLIITYIDFEVKTKY